MLQRLIPVFLLVLLLPLFGCCQKITFTNEITPLIPKQQKFKNKGLALILGGGGAKGIAHVGVLEELHKAGIKPDLIIGCSAGAIVGGVYAANPDIEKLKKLILCGKKSDVMIVSMSEWPYSIYGQTLLRTYLQKHLKHHNFKDLKIPFIAIATNLQFGNVTAFSKGDMIEPILASAAYPGAFQPIKINNQYFVDGGIADPVPVRFAKNLGFKTIIAVNIAEQLPDTSPNHLLGVIKRSMEISYIKQCQNSIESADVVIDFDFKNIGTFSDGYNDYLYSEGKKGARKAIPAILKKLAR